MKTTLNPVAKKWVKALRSKKYKQGKSHLNKDGRYCCLGVACDLAVKAGVIEEGVIGSGGSIYYDGGDGVLPDSVAEWLGLSSACGGFTVKGKDTDLTILNDGGRRFTTIAKIIESKPDGLFVAGK